MANIGVFIGVTAFSNTKEIRWTVTQGASSVRTFENVSGQWQRSGVGSGLLVCGGSCPAPLMECGMKILSCAGFELPLPEGHRFPVRKYDLLAQQVTEAGLCGPNGPFIPNAATDEELLRVHDAAYLSAVVEGTLGPEEVRRIGLPWSVQGVERTRRSVGATMEACRAALVDGRAVSLAGGTHHAFPDHGEGYCLFNDTAVAIRAMQAEARAQRVLVIDLDVHQGNGTAAIFAGDASVFTLSLHGARNFPFRKQKSSMDVELPDGTTDEPYLMALAMALPRALKLFKADLAIHLAGADPFAGDSLGRMSLSKEGLAARDDFVFNACNQVGLPVAVTMAGGYARDIQDTVDIHFKTVCLAHEMR